MDGLTGFQRDLLYTIAGLDEPTGLAIKDELDEYYETQVTHGRLYSNLDKLAERGLVNKSQQDDRTNAYRTTHRGRREIRTRREWKNQYLDFDGTIE